jgi:hypothetical protein
LSLRVSKTEIGKTPAETIAKMFPILLVRVVGVAPQNRKSKRVLASICISTNTLISVGVASDVGNDGCRLRPNTS